MDEANLRNHVVCLPKARIIGVYLRATLTTVRFTRIFGLVSSKLCICNFSVEGPPVPTMTLLVRKAPMSDILTFNFELPNVVRAFSERFQHIQTSLRIVIHFIDLKERLADLAFAVDRVSSNWINLIIYLPFSIVLSP